MNKISNAIVAVCAVTALVLATPVIAAETASEAPPLVKIDGENITQQDLDTFFHAFFYRKDVRKKLSSLPEFRRKAIIARGKGKALKKLIQRKLLLSAARQRFVKNDKIEKVIDTMTDNRLEQIKNSVDSWVGFVKDLHERDVSLREWKNLLRESILIQNFVHRETRDSIRIRPVEVKRYYENHRQNYTRPRTIIYRLLVVDPDTCDKSTSPEEMARHIRKKVADGADFARLAEKYSINRNDTQGGLKRVEVPDNKPNWMPPVVQGLKPGELSTVQKTDSGYSIARLEKILPAGPKPYKEVQNQIQKRLRKNRRRQVRKKLLKRLRQDANVEILPAGKELIGSG